MSIDCIERSDAIVVLMVVIISGFFLFVKDFGFSVLSQEIHQYFYFDYLFEFTKLIACQKLDEKENSPSIFVFENGKLFGYLPMSKSSSHRLCKKAPFLGSVLC